MKIKLLPFVYILSVCSLAMSVTGCMNQQGQRQVAQVEYAQPVHVSKSVRRSRTYAASSKQKTMSGVIKPYASSNKKTTSPGLVKPFVENSNNSNTYVARSVDSSADENSYVVKPGDTLYSVAFSHGRDYRDIERLNNIDEPYNITVGQRIYFTNEKTVVASNVTQSSSAKTTTVKEPVRADTYVVKAGDTAVSVAKANGLTFSQLIKANNLQKPYHLYKGQVLSLDVNNALPKETKVTPSVVPVAGSNTTQVATASTKTPAVISQEPTKIVSGRAKNVSGIAWMWPVRGSVIRNFSSANKGLDIAGSRGQSVSAAADGQVVYSGNALRGYGNLVIINHNNEFLSAYAHNDMLLVKEGQRVKRGQVIAKMGSTDASRVMLHFEIRYRGNSVNPRKYLP